MRQKVPLNIQHSFMVSHHVCENEEEMFCAIIYFQNWLIIFQFGVSCTVLKIVTLLLCSVMSQMLQLIIVDQ